MLSIFQRSQVDQVLPCKHIPLWMQPIRTLRVAFHELATRQCTKQAKTERIILHTRSGRQGVKEPGLVGFFSKGAEVGLCFQASNSTPSNLFYPPGIMFFLMICTLLLRSGRVCSCQKPTTWPSSCTTIPNLSQFFPIEMAWAPFPRLPTKEQHLKSVGGNLLACIASVHVERSPIWQLGSHAILSSHEQEI